MTKTTRKIPSLIDRGYGIGRHSWNNTFFANGFGSPAVEVRQIICYDVHGYIGWREGQGLIQRLGLSL